jgi:hypothetical protein
MLMKMSRAHGWKVVARSWAAMVGVACAIVLAMSAARAATTDADVAMNAPDEFAWRLFFKVNAPAMGSAGQVVALWETWASDNETFQPNPKPWPVNALPLALHPRALLLARPPHLVLQVVPGATPTEPSEETRRNEPSYNFIVSNNLYKRSGLAAAFGKLPMAFPVDAVEIKANWFPVLNPKDKTKSGIPGYPGAISDTAKVYYVSTASDGVQYALAAMHVISKVVPNWSWATFEHKNNPARCDLLGCKDAFGAVAPWVAPAQSPDKGYGACAKTPAWTQLAGSVKANPVLTNYCLKGAQTDFTTATGQAIRLGNSITESGFVSSSSCMTCHSRAGFDSTGAMSSNFGFDNASAPIGAAKASWFYTSASGTPPYDPMFENQRDMSQIAQPVDFVWSIPMCAIDDGVTPIKPTPCARK